VGRQSAAGNAEKIVSVQALSAGCFPSPDARKRGRSLPGIKLVIIAALFFGAVERGVGVLQQGVDIPLRHKGRG